MHRIMISGTGLQLGHDADNKIVYYYHFVLQVCQQICLSSPARRCHIAHGGNHRLLLS